MAKKKKLTKDKKKGSKEAKTSLFVMFFRRYFNILLTFLLLLFVFRPYDRGFLYIGIWQFCFTGVLLSSIFNCNHHKYIQIITTILAIPALICNWIAHYIMSPFIEFTYLLFSFLFVFVCVCSIISRVILSARVTLETLRGVICVYFMIGFGFSYLYMLIEFFNPQSFSLLEGILKSLPSRDIFVHNHVMSEIIFYSFVTLITIGFGDIHVIRDTAQTFTILEGIIGQFYIAILVSRIIAVYSYYSHKEEKEPVAFSSQHDVHE